MTVWTGKRDGFSTRETWTTDEFPNYWITHDDGAPFYVAGHRVAGALGRADKFFKAEDMVRQDAGQVAPATQVEDAPRTEGRCGHWIVRRNDQWEHWAAHDGARCRTRLPLEPA